MAVVDVNVDGEEKENDTHTRIQTTVGMEEDGHRHG
jgi:hypothetical protein